MIISDVALRKASDFTEISAKITPETLRHGRKSYSFRLWFRVRGVQLDIPLWADPFVVAFLAPCMYSNEDIRVEAPVSRRLLETIPRIQDTYHAWFAGFNKIEIRCAEMHGPAYTTSSPGASSMFSGGLDSWYTLLKNQSEITHLLLIRGFEVKSDDDALWERAARGASNAARSLGKTAVFVETNLKRHVDISHRNCKWGKPYPGLFWITCLGSALAAVSLCLQGIVLKAYIPSSYQTKDLFAHGSHPDLDPLWSTDNVQFIHDGNELNRLGKMRAQLSKSPVALQNLRVCWQNIPDVLNCCRCEKCLRTMIVLRLCGVLDQATAFHKPLTMGKVRRIYVFPPHAACLPQYHGRSPQGRR